MRLVDIDSLKGCAIIRPTSSEEIAHIQACSGLISHKDIPTAYDVEAVVAELEAREKSYRTASNKKSIEFLQKMYYTGIMRGYEYSREVVQNGGKE